jgi:hypothetical protein
MQPTSMTIFNAKFFVLWAYFSFLCSQIYKVFEIDILRVCGIYHWPHPDFLSIFFEAPRCEIEISKTTG